MPMAEAVSRLKAEADARTIRQAAVASPPEAVSPESEGEQHAY
jgi:hypothetical protein